MQYEVVIGLEVHAQLLTKSKIFCSCSSQFGSSANTLVCPICLGMPGTLPVLNRKVVEYALRVALATNCRINQRSFWARKNYFYPDLPKNYQISMYEVPLAQHGQISILIGNTIKNIGISRVHIEEDAGKLLHDICQSVSYIDFNRTGVPLIEIVSDPDLRTPEEAVAYLKALRSILLYLDVCDGNMEEGSFRCDVNVSVKFFNQTKNGTRIELKNINSFRYIAKALEYEIYRQRNLIERGIAIQQETRYWDSRVSKTVSMRNKEDPNDYRYFPEPDLLPLILDQDLIDKVRSEIPELPDSKRSRFFEQYKIPYDCIEILVTNKLLANYFEDLVKAGVLPKIASNWIVVELLGILNAQNKEIVDNPIRAESLAKLLVMLENKKISGKMAKEIFIQMFTTGEELLDIINKKNFYQISDIKILEDIIAKIIAVNHEQVIDFKAGEKKILDFFVGQVMKETKGRANPIVARNILREMLTR